MFIDLREREGRREGERQRDIDRLPPMCTSTGDRTHNVCDLTRTRTHNLFVYGIMLQSTEPSG